MKQRRGNGDIACLSETFGNVVGEALWCGTPLVGFADGMGVSSQVVTGLNGVLVDPGRGEGIEEADAALGRAVLDLIRNPSKRLSLGAGASRRARERFDAGVMVAAYERLFREIAARRAVAS
jgi:glycosyltransferase involved in cell wall biosynthesis